MDCYINKPPSFAMHTLIKLSSEAVEAARRFRDGPLHQAAVADASCVLTLDPRGPAISSWDGTAANEPSAETLQRLADAAASDLVQALAACCSISLMPGDVYLRVKRPRRGTRPHSDMGHFADQFRPAGAPWDACCFCGQRKADAEVATCQRCRGGGLRTLWLPLLEEGAVHGRHSVLEFRDHGPQSVAFGEAVWFDGDTEHQASDGNETRVSLDVRFSSHRLATLRLAPGAMALARQAWRLINDDWRMRRDEAINYTWLLALMEPELPQEAVADSCWRRERPREHGAREEQKIKPDTSKLGPAFVEWVEARWQAPLITLRQLAIACARQLLGKGPLRLRKNGVVHAVDWNRTMMATHVAFMATGYLLRPGGWTELERLEPSACATLRVWLLDAANKVSRHADPEVWMELAPIVWAVFDGPRYQLCVDEADALEQRARRVARGRSDGDVCAHMRFLVAWAASLLERRALHER